MTDAQIIADVKLSVRQNSDEVDAFLKVALNRIYHSEARRNNWPALRVTGATITVTGGTLRYDLPTDFDRLASEFVNYGGTLTNGTYQGGAMLPVIRRGSLGLDNVAAGFEMGGTSGSPRSVSVAPSSTTGQLALYLYPAFSDVSQIIAFDYYRLPTTLTGAGVTIEIPILAETLYAALAKEYMRFLNRLDQASYFAQQEREERNLALRSLATQ